MTTAAENYAAGGHASTPSGDAPPRTLGITSWYAACESGHFIWAGPDRPTEEAAEEDAREHDRRMHGGVPNAGVLPGL